MLIIGMLTGGGLTALGFLLGHLPSRRRGYKAPKPICGCRHHYSMHDPQTGQCHAMVDGESTPIRKKDGSPLLDNYGYVQKIYAEAQCPCRRYTGPTPLPTHFAQEIAAS